MTTTPDPSDSETTENWSTIAFLPAGDDGSASECDPWLQDCAEGDKCVPYSTDGSTFDANRCVPITGDGAPGDPCTYGGVMQATDDCDANSACFDVVEVEGELVGTCHAFCTGSPESPECPAGSTCALSADGDFALCIPDCDPVAQDCERGLGCYWNGSSFECVPSENLPAGEQCEFANACAIGLICVAAQTLPDCQGVGCCAPFCDIELGDTQCEELPGTSCVPFYEEGTAPPGYELVGVCILP